MERQAGEPGLADQVGQRFAGRNAVLQQSRESGTVLGRKRAREFGVVEIRRKAQHMRHHPGGFVDRSRGAMTEEQPGLVHRLGSSNRPLADAAGPDR